jgi:hypothetical protein
MNIESIDNVSEEDGLILLQSFVAGLNAEYERNPNDPTRRMLIAILPEYGDDGRLLRLDCLTVPVEDPGVLTADMADLMTAVDAIVKEEQAKRAAAYARLDAEQLPSVVPLPTVR